MKSKTKVTLLHTDVQRLVEQAYGNAPIISIRELADGYFNTAYHIKLGEDLGHTVLKVGPPVDADVLTYERNILRAEVDAMRMAATDPAIPTPPITFDDFSRTCVPYEYYFMDFVEGTTWDKVRESLSDQQNKQIEAQLGRITARINAFEHATFGYFAYGPSFDNWPDAFRWMCEALFDDARRFGITLELPEAEFFEKLDEYSVIFNEVERPQLVHWDLWAGNVFVSLDGDTPEIVGLFDFERALWGDPLMEAYLARLDGLSDYMAGYGENLLSTRSQRLRRIFYNVYLFLIMIIEDGPRQYEDKGSVTWAQTRLLENVAMLAKLPARQGVREERSDG